MVLLARLIVCLTVLAAAPLGAAAEPYSVGPVRLGMSLAELRGSSQLTSGNRIICNTEPAAFEITRVPDVLPDLASGAPGPACGIFRFGKRLELGSSLPDEWVPARLQLGPIEIYPSLSFVAGDKPEASPRLARVTLRSNAAYWDSIVSTLTSRYGKPAARERSNQPYPDNETVTWDNGDSTITASKRSDRYQRTTIVMEHKALAALAGWRAAGGGTVR